MRTNAKEHLHTSVLFIEISWELLAGRTLALPSVLWSSVLIVSRIYQYDDCVADAILGPMPFYRCSLSYITHPYFHSLRKPRMLQLSEKGIMA
jgi:hypothetical protein